MFLNPRGFTLPEMLIALALSSATLLGAARLLPALQKGVMTEYRAIALREAMWQLAFGLGKNLQRAGYCRGSCSGEGVILSNAGSCVLLQWDANSNGRWETSAQGQSEQTGYRLRGGDLEILRGALNCEGKGWEKISDPGLVKLTAFSVTRLKRGNGPPLLKIMLAAKVGRTGRAVALRHVVVGHNL